MNTYSKINTLFKRDMTLSKNPIIMNEWASEEFEYLANNIWTGTEKIDGTNTRIQWKAHENTVAYKGKTDEAGYFPGMLEMLTALLSESKMLEVFPVKENPYEVCLYGETYGKVINKGGLYGSNLEFILFDIKVGSWWLKRDAVEDIARQLNIRCVPVVFSGTLHEAIEKVKQGFHSVVSQSPLIAEGLILMPATQLMDRKGDRIITKIKHKDFQHMR